MAGAGTTKQVGGLTNGGGGSGTVTQVSVASANGFSGTVANDTTTPTITIQSTGTSTRAAFANATSGLDYSSGLTLNTTTVIGMTTAGTLNLNTTGSSTITMGNSGNSVPVNIVSKVAPSVTTYTTSTTAAIENIALHTKSTSGTPGAGYGNKINFYADTNGGTDRNLGYISGRWLTATDASRVGYFEFRVANNTGVVQTVDVVPGGFNLYGTTSGVVSLKVAAAAGTWDFTLPVDNGTAGQFLQTDGNGVGSWATASGGGSQSSVVKSGIEAGLFTNTFRTVGGVATSNLIFLSGQTNVVRYNGSTWTTTAHGGAASSMGTLAVHGDVVCIAGTGTTGRRSTDGGATWGNITVGYAATNPHYMATSGNTWMYTVSNLQTTAMRSSDDGITWGNITIHGSSIGSRGVNTDGAGNWQALTASTATRYSTDDGATFAAATALSGTPKTGLYANGYFWALLDSAKQLAYTSTANGSWSYVALPGLSGTNLCNGWWYANSKMYYVDGAHTLWSCADPTQSTAVWLREGDYTPCIANAPSQAYYYNSSMYVLASDGTVYQVTKI